MIPPITITACKHGRGVFAADFIAKGSLILVFSGPIISLDQAVSKGEKSFNSLQIGPNQYLDTEQPGMFVNHSCEPNAGIRADIYLVALRDIQPGEEITFDYSTSMSEKLETMACQCGCPSCRRIIGDFHDLPNELKVRYLQQGIVQSFIVQEHHGFLSGNKA